MKKFPLRFYLLTALFVISFVWYIAFRVMMPLAANPYQSGPMNGNDFKHMYLGSQLLVAGENPYDPPTLFQAARDTGFQQINPYVYLPFTGIVMSPLAYFDPVMALRIWFVLNHVMALSALLLIALTLRDRISIFTTITAGLTILAFSAPWGRTLSAGQLNAVLLLGIAAVLYCVRSGRMLIAGSIAAFCFLFKIWPGIFFVYFAWRAIGEWRRGRKKSARSFALGFAPMLIVSLVFFVVSIAIVGLQRHLDFMPLLRDMSYGRSTWWQAGNTFYRDAYNQSFNSFFHHVLVPRLGFTPWFEATSALANNLTKLAVALIAALVAWRSFPPRKRSLDEAVTLSLYLVGGLLVPSIYWDHYAVLMLIPMIALLACGPKHTLFALAAMLLLLLPTHLGSEIFLLPAVSRAFGFVPEKVLKAIVIAQLISLIFTILLTVFYRMKFKTTPTPILLWPFCAALIGAKVFYHLPALTQGAGLLMMSAALWGTLLLLGLSLVSSSANEESTNE